MLYDKETQEEMLSALEDRVLSISNAVVVLLKEGYVPNKNKYTVVDFATLLYNAYENINVFTKEQQDKLDALVKQLIPKEE